MSLESQVRLARMLGINEAYTLYNGAAPVEGQTPFFFWNADTPACFEIFDRIVTDNTAGAGFWSDFLPPWTPRVICIYPPMPSRMTRYEQVYIRTSTNSNLWDTEGCKINGMDIVAITEASLCNVAAE